MKYDFKNVKTGEVKEYSMSWKDLDQFKKNNPDLQQQIGAPNMITRRDGDVLKKAGAGWNEVLQKVGESHPGSEVAKKNIRRTAKQVKTEAIVKKHAALQTGGKPK